LSLKKGAAVLFYWCTVIAATINTSALTGSQYALAQLLRVPSCGC
jgi:hypothetical protein